MERKYMKPVIEVERFAANEYIAACSDTTNEYYKFVCDGHGWFGAGGDVYEETNGKDGLQRLEVDLLGIKADTYLGPYHQCQIEHYVKKDSLGKDVFKDGYLVTIGNVVNSMNVLIWKGENNDNIHVTKGLKEEIQIVEGNLS